MVTSIYEKHRHEFVYNSEASLTSLVFKDVLSVAAKPKDIKKVVEGLIEKGIHTIFLGPSHRLRSDELIQALIEGGRTAEVRGGQLIFASLMNGKTEEARELIYQLIALFPRVVIYADPISNGHRPEMETHYSRIKAACLEQKTQFYIVDEEASMSGDDWLTTARALYLLWFAE